MLWVLVKKIYTTDIFSVAFGIYIIWYLDHLRLFNFRLPMDNGSYTWYRITDESTFERLLVSLCKNGLRESKLYVNIKKNLSDICNSWYWFSI